MFEFISVMWKWNRGIISSFLADTILYTVTAEVTELSNRKKSVKDVVYFQPEDNHEMRIAKSEKIF